jgi:hypothetical protein
MVAAFGKLILRGNNEKLESVGICDVGVSGTRRK